eukprot:1184451-Prorocentrum_minimum.AAC.1
MSSITYGVAQTVDYESTVAMLSSTTSRCPVRDLPPPVGRHSVTPHPAFTCMGSMAVPNNSRRSLAACQGVNKRTPIFVPSEAIVDSCNSCNSCDLIV